MQQFLCATNSKRQQLPCCLRVLRGPLGVRLFQGMGLGLLKKVEIKRKCFVYFLENKRKIVVLSLIRSPVIPIILK